MTQKPLLAALLALLIGAASAPLSAQSIPDPGSLEGLRLRAAALRGILKTDVCANRAAAEALLVYGGAAAKPQASGARTATVPQGEAANPLPRKELAESLSQSVVLILAGEGSGSGFFVAPNTIMTNSHVVAGASKILVAGRGLDRPYVATLVATTNAQGPAAQDYAILKIRDAPAVKSLPISPAVPDLAPVIAGGFPGLLLSTDNNFKALLGGDLSAMPDLAMSQGAIVAKQNQERGLPILAHSAAISGGNSGGPLIDMCGRVVGINSFINVSVKQASNAGFAIAASDMVRYLQKYGVNPEIRQNACSE